MRVLLCIVLGYLLARVSLPEALPTPLWLLFVVVFALGSWLLLATSAMMLGLVAERVLEVFQRWTHENRQKRPRYLIPPLRLMAGLLGIVGGMPGLPARIHLAIADFHRGWGESAQALRAISRRVSASKQPLERLRALDSLLEALAWRQQRQAFAVAFVTAETQVRELLKAEGLTPSDSEGQRGHGLGTPEEEGRRERARGIERLLYPANLQRAVLAFRAGDFRDARHWMRRCEQYDAAEHAHLLLDAEACALEGHHDESFQFIRRARERAEAAATREGSMQQRLLELARAMQQKVRAGGGELAVNPVGAMLREGGVPVAEASSDLEALAEGIVAQANRNALWDIAWCEIKAAFFLGEAARIDHVLDSHRELLEGAQPAAATIRVQALIGRMLAACLRKQGHAVEAPYAKALVDLRWERVHPSLRAEVPLLRGIGLVHRGMPEPALLKFDEIRGGPIEGRPPLYLALADAYSAWCLEKMGRASEGIPHWKTAQQHLAEGTSLRALKLVKKIARQADGRD